MARVMNCVVSRRITKHQISPIEHHFSKGVQIQFALSLTDEFVEMHPFGKAVLLALAVVHVSRSQFYDWSVMDISL